MLIIAEKINASSQSVGCALAARDEQAIRRLIAAQAAAGCDYLDLNAGQPGIKAGEETDDLRWLIDQALEVTETPLCLDSARSSVLAAGVKHLAGARPFLLNSVNARPKSLEALLPLAAEHNAPIVAMALGADGVPPTSRERVETCGALYRAALQAHIPPEHLIFDPVTLPLRIDPNAARVTLEAIWMLKANFPEVRVLIGLANVSYELKQRRIINHAFAVGAVQAGADAAILDPADIELRRLITAAETLAGRQSLTDLIAEIPSENLEEEGCS